MTIRETLKRFSFRRSSKLETVNSDGTNDILASNKKKNGIGTGKTLKKTFKPHLSSSSIASDSNITNPSIPPAKIKVNSNTDTRFHPSDSNVKSPLISPAGLSSKSYGFQEPYRVNSNADTRFHPSDSNVKSPLISPAGLSSKSYGFKEPYRVNSNADTRFHPSDSNVKSPLISPAGLSSKSYGFEEPYRVNSNADTNKNFLSRFKFIKKLFNKKEDTTIANSGSTTEDNETIDTPTELSAQLIMEDLKLINEQSYVNNNLGNYSMDHLTQNSNNKDLTTRAKEVSMSQNQKDDQDNIIVKDEYRMDLIVYVSSKQPREYRIVKEAFYNDFHIIQKNVEPGLNISNQRRDEIADNISDVLVNRIEFDAKTDQLTVKTWLFDFIIAYLKDATCPS
ncbi:Mineralocorticoid receptor [Wickerhamomyces ciferrii]|uniref:Mineralocorticoid receptor n=1 Tax=Wickerhamomyces ciferrii (strain ATCC 14091 / BCRC 22168 / CBS 111 / JCM 3599 / NBRC 0793 / NRRL Y-1031 F-60-10) TaxID=1206466 RepID=K0KEA0_WICCF|nr:Mineralocorticoid receptor [Wickerhamomyces ciferrii]CCH43445.1 Mineralocorticoid receptor [Wickerhamomyces ciferrii]